MSLIREMTAHFGLGKNDLTRLIWSTPARYKVYEIPKRKGGTKTIAQPSRELKSLQRFVIKKKLRAFPVHSAAMAYVGGRNIGVNASAHKEARAILKLDFADFFPSIRTNDWVRYARAHPVKEIDRKEIPLYAQILFWGVERKSKVPLSLSIGAPSSPVMSNIFMFELDQQLATSAAECGVVYTRYADDITASAQTVEELLQFETAVRRTIKKVRSPSLVLNERKCGLYLKGQRRMVTGLIVTPQREVSIGRARKRRVSAMFHHASLGRLDEEGMGRLKGYVGFCLAVEPEFISRRRVKHTNEVVDRVLRYRVPERGAP